MAGLKFDITGNANGYLAATRQVEASTARMTRSVSTEGAALDSIFKKIATSAAAIGAGFSAQKLISDIVRVRGEFQKLEIAMETMLGSTDKANDLMSQLTQTAAKTPFGLTDIAQGAKQLLAYGTASEQVNETLIRLGNIASGLSIPLNDLVYLYGTTMTQGRLFTQDLRQFMGRGIPIADELAKQFGVTKDKVAELVTAGRVGFPEVEKAIASMTNEGGKFYNLMEKQSSSLTGQISNLEDQFDMMLNELGIEMQDALAGGISLVSKLVENYETVGRAIGAVAATYGTYRAAVIAVTVAEKAQAVARLASITQTTMLSAATGALAKKFALLNAIMKANPYVLIATAAVGLGTAIWALSDHTTAAEKAQKRYNQRLEESAKIEDERKREVEKAIDVVNDLNKADADRVKALLLLKKEYPGIFTQYDIEKIKLADILDLKKQIAEEDRKKKVTSMEEEYAANAKWLNEYRSTYNKGGKAFKKEYETRQETQKIARQDYTNEKVDEYIAGMKEKSTEYLQKVLDIANRANAGNGQFLLEGTKVMSNGAVDLTQLKTLAIEGENLVQVIESINSELSRRNEVIPTYDDAYKAAEESWKKEKKKLEEIKNNRSKYTKEQYDEQVLIEQEKRKAFQELGGDTTGKTSKLLDELRKAEETEANLKNEYANKALRQQEDLDNQLEQARINSLKDGVEKRLAQMALDNRMELQQIKRAKEDFIDAYVDREKAIFDAEEKVKASKNKDYQKQTFNEDAAREKAMKSYEVQKYDELYESTKNKQESDYREQEVTIIKQVNNELLGEYKTYEQKRNDIISKYAKEREKLYEKDSSGNVMKGADGSPVLKSGVTKGNLDEIDIAEKEDLNAIDEMFAAREVAFQAWMNEIANLTLSQLKSVLNEAENELASLESKNPSDSNIASARSKVSTLKKKINEKEANTQMGPGERSIDEWKDLQDALKDCVDAFDEIGDAVGGVAGEIISTAGNIASSTLSMINGIVQLVSMSSASMTATAKAAANAISTVEKASVILAVISAALQIVMAIVNAVKKAIAAKHEEKIKQLTEANEKLEESYNRLEKSIEDAYSVDASKLIKQQNTLLNQKKKNLELLIAEEEAYKKSDDDQIKDWKKQIEDIKDEIKENVEEAKEAILGISFDGFRDNFLDALLDMEEGVDGLSDTIEEDIRKAMYEALLTDDAFENKLKNLYNDLAAAIESGDAREVDKLKAAILNLYNMQEEKAREIDDKLGYEPKSTRSATEKGIVQASQTSVDELNGRATAIQSHTFSINERVGSIVNITTQILSRVISIDSKTSRLEDIERSLVLMRSDISDILNRGIKIKA